MHSKLQRTVFAGLAALAMGTPALAHTAIMGPDADFPLREKYNDCQTVSSEQLASWMGQAIIVDARNNVEFDVIHIDGAVNILVDKMTEASLLKLREKNGETPIVFYCNGVTCSKSYKATVKAMEMGFENVFVFDAGVFTFFTLYPEHGKFFGETLKPGQVESSLISKDELSSISIQPAEFIEKATNGGYAVFDVRDTKDRNEFPINLPGVKKISMDQFVKFLDRSGSIPSSQFVVLDNVGKQVKWLHYYLKQAGRTDFFFLEGGVAEWQVDGFDSNGKPGAVAGVSTND